jgi:hypothetical protein
MNLMTLAAGGRRVLASKWWVPFVYLIIPCQLSCSICKVAGLFLIVEHAGQPALGSTCGGQLSSNTPVEMAGPLQLLLTGRGFPLQAITSSSVSLSYRTMCNWLEETSAHMGEQ